MKELLRTGFFCLVAGILIILAVMFDPGSSTPKIFSDQGELFYPGFTDPQAPKVIEVIDYDESTATARPLKVEYKNNKWLIPSHYGYPADAEERLAKTAAALIDLRKDSIVSDNVEDQAKYGVIDPLDQGTTSLTGRGKRVTFRDASGNVLGDFVIGKAPDGKPAYRYVRVPGQTRTYLVKTEAEVSAHFEDWIETDLLKLSPNDIRRIVINRYSINKTFGILQNVENTALAREADRWTLSGGGVPRKEKVEELTKALASLRITDVQPKPLGLSRDLKTPEGIRLSPEAIISLRQKGYFVTPMGQLLSNEGELIVETVTGLQYTLRFGEIAAGTSVVPSEGETSSKEGAKDHGERRYLFITVNYNPARAQHYAGEGKAPGEKGKELERELRNRFADWYYIISGTDYQKLRPQRKDLVKG
jgi:hypothetical protein